MHWVLGNQCLIFKGRIFLSSRKFYDNRLSMLQIPLEPLYIMILKFTLNSIYIYIYIHTHTHTHKSVGLSTYAGSRYPNVPAGRVDT